MGMSGNGNGFFYRDIILGMGIKTRGRAAEARFFGLRARAGHRRAGRARAVGRRAGFFGLARFEPDFFFYQEIFNYQEFVFRGTID